MRTLYDVQLWHVTPVTDAAGGVQLQVTGPLGTIRALLSKARGWLRRLGVGEEVQYDVSVLVRNLPTNTWFFPYQNAEPWLYFVVTDQDSGWYGSVLRVETMVPSHGQQDGITYHVVCLCNKLEEDKVQYINGQLVAKG